MRPSAEHPDHIDLMAFADRELPEHLAAEVRDHVDACATCQARLGAWTNLFVSIEQAGAIQASPDLRSRVMRSLQGTREAGNRVRWLLIGELLASIGLLVVLFGVLSQLSQVLVQQIEPVMLQPAMEDSLQSFVLWFEDSQAALTQTAIYAWEAVETPLSGFEIPASWWPWMAAFAVVWLLGNGLLLDSASLNPFRKGDQRG